MSTYKEIDVIRVRRSVEADVLGEHATFVVPSGSLGTVVLVHGPAAKPSAYEIEFYVAERDAFALATVDADSVTAA
jgi:Domain of unknown function (DUF4926)